ncbi:MAG TPA: hypothetical protein VF884_12840 [Nitrososphaeraceae archaeon]
MDDKQLKNNLVYKLKEIIDGKFRIGFLPNDDSFTEIKVTALAITNKITKEILENTISDLWLRYFTVTFQFERQHRWPNGSFDPSKHV